MKNISTHVLNSRQQHVDRSLYPVRAEVGNGFDDDADDERSSDEKQHIPRQADNPYLQLEECCGSGGVLK